MKPLTPEQCQTAITEYGSKRAAAAALGVPRTTFRRWCEGDTETYGSGDPADQFQIDRLPSEELDIDDLLEFRRKKFLKKREYEEETKLIPIKIKMDGPVGLLHFGDPHVDDDGTDIFALERDAKIVRDTEGMFGGNVGDTTNNWIGRLARLYGEQGTTASEAWILAEWWLNIMQDYLLYMIAGNHDLWSGSGDPLKWITYRAQGVYKSSEVRMNLEFPNGRTIRLNAHHDFAGNSQYNPAHGAMKAALMGFHDHVLINGHKHVSGYGMIKDPNQGIISHCIQVASYKVYDRFAREKGFRDQHVSPCAVTIFNPYASEERGLVTVIHDPEEAADYLNFRRAKWERIGK